MSRRDGPPSADHQLGIRAGGAVPLPLLGLAGPSAPHAERYEPTPYGVLDDLLLSLPAPQGLAFVDLGAGKGRVVCQAALHPFRRVLGLELSPLLVREAQDNLRRAARRFCCREVSVVEGDAAEYAWPAEPTVAYLFNPFAAPVVARVRAALEAACVAGPAERYVAYYMPLHRQVFDQSGWLRPRAVARDWVIYERHPAALV